MRIVSLGLLLSSDLGCSEPADGGARSMDRGFGGKADAIGSCLPDDCGGPASEGRCWCDAACVEYEDCCSNRIDVCESGQPPTGDDGEPAEPIGGNCCDLHGGLGCEVDSLETCVCDADPSCCNESWSAGCIARAVACGATCEDLECSTLAQDCPTGEKCMPWAATGGSWNGTRCTPIAAQTRSVGERCRVEGSAVSGVDDCAPGSMCWDVDAFTNAGYCIELCGGEGGSAACENVDTCTMANGGALAVCLPECDPLEQDCPSGEGCYPVEGSGFSCAHDGSFDGGAQGDSCGAVNTCSPGYVCAPSHLVPACTSDGGCCTSWCDLDDPRCFEGLECIPYGGNFAGFEHVGVCVAPL